MGSVRALCIIGHSHKCGLNPLGVAIIEDKLINISDTLATAGKLV